MHYPGKFLLIMAPSPTAHWAEKFFDNIDIAVTLFKCNSDAIGRPFGKLSTWPVDNIFTV